MYSTKRKNGGIRLGRWKSVIDVTRINNTRFVLNCDLIQTVEETPDTVITLTTGTKYSCERKLMKKFKKKVLEYKRSIISVLNENM